MSAAEKEAMSEPPQGELGLSSSAPRTAMSSDTGQAPSARRHERRRAPRSGLGIGSSGRWATLEKRLAEERRRVAAEIHDLIMQDVSFALANARALAGEPGKQGAHAAAVVQAGERALAGARSIVRGLGERERRSVTELLEESVRLAARGVPLTLSSTVEPGVRPDGPTTDALVHIAREAVTNAVKHAGAGHISVSLTRDDEWRLRVSDDGCGFDQHAIARGFGLDSMAGQAGALGGWLRVSSADTGGTVIEVSLP